MKQERVERRVKISEEKVTIRNPKERTSKPHRRTPPTPLSRSRSPPPPIVADRVLLFSLILHLSHSVLGSQEKATKKHKDTNNSLNIPQFIVFSLLQKECLQREQTPFRTGLLLSQNSKIKKLPFPKACWSLKTNHTQPTNQPPPLMVPIFISPMIYLPCIFLILILCPNNTPLYQNNLILKVEFRKLFFDCRHILPSSCVPLSFIPL